MLYRYLLKKKAGLLKHFPKNATFCRGMIISTIGHVDCKYNLNIFVFIWKRSEIPPEGNVGKAQDNKEK